MPNGLTNGHDEDESMDQADAAALDAIESSYQRSSTANGDPSSVPPIVPTGEKKKMRITCKSKPQDVD